MVTGKYTNKDNREIMEKIFEENENALNQNYAYNDPFWDKLGSKLNRRPYYLYKHWQGVIKPRILMYEHGREHLDFRTILIDYFIEKGILFRNETNWSEIVKDERFKGTTSTFLQERYGDLVRKVKNKYPGIEDDEITSEVIKSYRDGINRRQTKDAKGDFSRLIEDYLAIKEKM